MLAVAAFCLAPLLQQLEFLGSPGLIYIEHNFGAKVLLFEGIAAYHVLELVPLPSDCSENYGNFYTRLILELLARCLL
jgi:hypothetical protein